MAVTAVGTRLWPRNRGLPYSYTAHALAAGDRFGAVLRAPATGDITKVGFRTGTVSDSQTLQVGIYTTSGGDPTAVLKGGAVGTQASPAAATWYEVTLGSACPVVAGDLIAPCIEWAATEGSLQIVSCALPRMGFPFGDLYDGASWTRQAYAPCISLLYGSDCYPCGLLPAKAFGSANIGNGNHIGAKFVAAAAERVLGLWVGASSGWTGSWEGHLYDVSDTSLASVVVAAGENFYQSGAWVPLECYFASAVTLSAGSTYRVAVKQTSATSIPIEYMQFNSAAEKIEVSGISGAPVYSTKSGTDAWVDDSTHLVPHMGLIVDGVDLGSAGATGFPATSQLEGMLQ